MILKLLLKRAISSFILFFEINSAVKLMITQLLFFTKANKIISIYKLSSNYCFVQRCECFADPF